MLDQIKKIIDKLYPELKNKLHLPRLGIIMSITEPPETNAIASAFRPRMACDIQLLNADGSADEKSGLLEAVPLPAFMPGDESGFFGFPQPGAKVRIGFDYGLATMPHIQAVLSDGLTVPALQPGEQLWQHSDGNFQKADGTGNWIRETLGNINEDSARRNLKADEVSEEFGKRTQIIKKDSVEDIGGSKSIEAGGEVKIMAGAGMKLSAVDDINVTTLGSLQQTSSGQIILTAVNAKGAIEGIKINAVLGGIEFKTGLGKVYVGTEITNIVQVLSDLLDEVTTITEDIEKLSYANGGGPTGPATNGTPLMLPHQVKLATDKALLDVML